QGRGEQVVADRVGGAGELEDQAVGRGGGQVGSGSDVDGAAHADVRRPAGVMQAGDGGDAAALADAAGAADVGQDQIDSAPREPLLELPAVALRLPGRYRHLQRGREPNVALNILRRERVFEPVDAQRLEPAADVQRVLGGIGAVGVDQQVGAATHRLG